MEETWKPVPYEPYATKYLISSLGRVKPVQVSKYSKNKAEYLSPVPSPRGYLFVSLYANGKQHSAFIHRMVALAFIGEPPPDKPYVLHRDDCQTNNVADNLQWGSEADNHRDRQRNGRDLIGTRNGMAKLSESDVIQMRDLYAAGGCTYKALALKFGVHLSLIHPIIHRQIWKHI